MKKILTCIFFIYSCGSIVAQPQGNNLSKVWVADNGDGSYKNPILHADYSDPDVIRVGEDYYLISSSFEHTPGLPVLHSKDMVNWTIINHALKKQIPVDVFNQPQHGKGVWAPAIRYHKNTFYIYYPDPDYGIYMIKASDPAKEWSQPLLVYAGSGLIDPCPLWDDDGKAWLIHAYAGSRAGFKSVISVAPMNAEGTAITGESQVIYDGHGIDPTLEGGKIYKRNKYYYIFAPAGGVPTGWQLVLRSKHILGPYERHVAIDQGTTKINGPHQGAWVVTQTGEDWFFHFQDKDAYGRVVHLQPIQWKKDWPVIGIDKDGDLKGEPVLVFKKPNVGNTYPICTPAESDEFNSTSLGLQWQWQANPKGTWLMPSNNGKLRLYAHPAPAAKNLWDVANILGQKFMAEEFTATTQLTFTPNLKLQDERAGLVILGLDYATIFIAQKADGFYLLKGICEKADEGAAEIKTVITKLKDNTAGLKVTVAQGGLCTFSYSIDGKTYIPIAEDFKAKPGRWVGAKIGLYATGIEKSNDTGYADFDWFRVDK